MNSLLSHLYIRGLALISLHFAKHRILWNGRSQERGGLNLPNSQLPYPSFCHLARLPPQFQPSLAYWTATLLVCSIPRTVFFQKTNGCLFLLSLAFWKSAACCSAKVDWLKMWLPWWTLAVHRQTQTQECASVAVLFVDLHVFAENFILQTYSVRRTLSLRFTVGSLLRCKYYQ